MSQGCVTIGGMLSDQENLPDQVEKEAGSLIAELCAARWIVFSSRYDSQSFGNWYVELCRAGLTFRIVKDRSKYMIDGPPKSELQPAGLWRAFDDFEEFRQAVAKWATKPDV